MGGSGSAKIFLDRLRVYHYVDLEGIEQLNMRRAMGNQNTTGLVEEERAANDAREKPNLGGDLKQDEQILNDAQKTTETVAQSDEILVVQSLSSENEEVNGSFRERAKNESADLHDNVSSNIEESKESNPEFEVCKLNNEVDDQPSNLKGEIQKTNLTLEFDEAVEITLDQQELQSIIIVEESLGTIELSDSGQIENAKIEENLIANDILKTDIHDADTEEVGLELSYHKENLEDGYEIETSEEPSKEEMNTCDSLPMIGSQDLTAERNEMPDKSLVRDEETVHELRVGDNSTFVDLTQRSHQEMNQSFSCSDAESETMQSDKKEINDKTGFSKFTESIPHEEPTVFGKANDVEKEIGLVKSEGLIPMTKNQEISTIEKGMSQFQVIVPDPEQNVEIITTEAQVPPSLFIEHFNNESFVSVEIKGAENAERNSIESIEDNGVKVELRKSSSFDFGLPFDARSGESDQTPLLYQDRTVLRSFSKYSTLVKCKVTDQVEEKTIRMEKSSSDNSRAKFSNLMKKEEKPASDEKQETGLKASNLTEECSKASPKGNEKRKQRSSLFTACICCTAEAIS